MTPVYNTTPRRSNTALRQFERQPHCYPRALRKRLESHRPSSSSKNPRRRLEVQRPTLELDGKRVYIVMALREIPLYRKAARVCGIVQLGGGVFWRPRWCDDDWHEVMYVLGMKTATTVVMALVKMYA